ncbi:hypothetical protein E1176_05805 [Fulvivirga sp. RKSG066]|nr:hypothetical protein [Fulvivirga aurantia]
MRKILYISVLLIFGCQSDNSERRAEVLIDTTRFENGYNVLFFSSDEKDSVYRFSYIEDTLILQDIIIYNNPED